MILSIAKDLVAGPRSGRPDKILRGVQAARRGRGIRAATIGFCRLPDPS
jgi:hypothetical protein